MEAQNGKRPKGATNTDGPRVKEGSRMASNRLTHWTDTFSVAQRLSSAGKRVFRNCPRIPFQRSATCQSLVNIPRACMFVSTSASAKASSRL